MTLIPLKTIQHLTSAEKRKALNRTLRAFVLFCEQNFQFDLYEYQLRIAEACLSSLLVEPKNVFIKLSRQSGNPRHLEYEKAFGRELREKGRENPEIRLNFYLEDMVGEGNFVSRERLLSCARSGGIIIPFESLYRGLDWARVSDETIATVGNDRNDVLEWFL